VGPSVSLDVVEKRTIPEGLWGPPSILFSGYHGFSKRVKPSQREANNSISSSTEKENMWRYVPLLPHVFHELHYE
jgi:hypothetical protein